MRRGAARHLRGRQPRHLPAPRRVRARAARAGQGQLPNLPQRGGLEGGLQRGHVAQQQEVRAVLCFSMFM